ncbi:MAG: hypothetical protein AAF726_21935 [Planctomycetota bacterium]
MLRLAAFTLIALVSSPLPFAECATAGALVDGGTALASPAAVQKGKKHRKREKAELKRLKPKLNSKDPKERTNALYEVAALSREHEQEPSKEVAEVLAAALDDESLNVRSVAIDLLVNGQHTETAIKAVIGVMKGFESNMFTLVGTLMGPKGKNDVDDAMRYLEVTMHSAGQLRDDRVASALASVLLAYPTEMRGEPVAMAASQSLLKFGTRDAVDAVIRQLDSRPEATRAKNIHDALAAFATRSEIEEVPAADDEDLKKAWRAWAKKNASRFPKKLGKLKWKPRPKEDEEDEGEDGEKDGDGRP